MANEPIEQQVARCLEDVTVTDGALARVDLVPGTFRIVTSQVLGDGATRYSFRATGQVASKSDKLGEPAGEPQAISGWIDLDEGFGLVREHTGQVRFGPWRCGDPDLRDLRAREAIGALLASVDETTPRLRVFFDPGAPTFLWSDNDAAREQYGEAVLPADLPVPDAVRTRLLGLMERYEAAQSSAEGRSAFERDLDQTLAQVRDATGLWIDR